MVDTNSHVQVDTQLAKPMLPAGLVYAGVIVGLVLIFSGIALWSFGAGSLLASLMTCVGFGLVLAAFGSTAKGEWAGWTVTGSGALAVVLFLVLQHFTPAPPVFLYKKGQLRGDFSKIADIRIIDELPMYGYRDRTTSSVRFVLLDLKLKSNRLSIQVDTTERGEGREFFEIVGDAKAIQERYLTDATSDNKQIQWTFDYERRVVKDGQEVIFSEQDRLLEPLVPMQRRSSVLDRLRQFASIATAHAAETVTRAKAEEIERLLAALKSDDASERRNARDALAVSGPASVATMMSITRSEPIDYRTRLGVVFALSEMLRRNPDKRAAISAALTDRDFPFLVGAASDNDLTIRLQAADFLYLLQDPRAVAPSIEAARSTPDESKATNQILIIRQAGQSFSAEDKDKVVRDLAAGSAPRNDLVGRTDVIKKKLGW